MKWLPTSENINALPDPIRSYIHELEARADPSGDVRELVICRDTCKSLEVEVQRWKEQAFRPLGDNHHNAAICPYCSPQEKK